MAVNVVTFVCTEENKRQMSLDAIKELLLKEFKDNQLYENMISVAQMEFDFIEKEEDGVKKQLGYAYIIQP